MEETTREWDPVHIAWQASHPDALVDVGGDCARCAGAAGTVKVSEVVSKKFTAWDTWADPGCPRLCVACAWAYRTVRLRAEVLVVTALGRGPSCRSVSPPGLLELLAYGPLPGDVAVSVPLRAGRRHVLPMARFGQVCLDGTNLAWSRGDARLARLVARLRGQGVPWSAFTDPVPPWRALRRCNDPEGLLACWEELGPWRASGLWLQVALVATHPARGQAA